MLSIWKLTPIFFVQDLWSKRSWLYLVLQVSSKSLRVHLDVNISKNLLEWRSHEYSSIQFSTPSFGFLLFGALSWPRCHFVFIFPNILYKSLTIPLISLYSFNFFLFASNKTEFFAVKFGSWSGHNVFKGTIVFYHCHLQTLRKN